MSLAILTHDFAMWLYVVTLFFCVIGYPLFFWWGINSTKKPDVMFWYVSHLLFGIGLSVGISCYARYLYLMGGGEKYTAFLVSTVWNLRISVIAVCVIGIVCHGYWRYFKNGGYGSRRIK